MAAVIVGSIAALYGILGLGQAAQNCVHVAYAIPRNSRPNPLLSRLQSGLYLLLAGGVVIAVATLTSVAANWGAFGARIDWTFGLLVDLVSILLTATVFAVLIRTATLRRESYRQVFVGALVTAVLWQLLQKIGRVYVNHVVTRAHDEVNGVFAVTLGLVALIYVAANMAVIGVQVNVVLAKHLWPRALLTPFTDAVQLTEADRRAYAAYAKAQRHKGFENVEVTFHDPPDAAAEQEPAEPRDDERSGSRDQEPAG
ncbi:MAG: rane protein [Streptomyces sp.]|nr:rane protein [Streptomyces sp.]